MVNKTQCLRHSWALPSDSKHNEARFSTKYRWICYAFKLLSMWPKSPDPALVYAHGVNFINAIVVFQGKVTFGTKS